MTENETMQRLPLIATKTPAEQSKCFTLHALPCDLIMVEPRTNLQNSQVVANTSTPMLFTLLMARQSGICMDSGGMPAGVPPIHKPLN